MTGPPRPKPRPLPTKAAASITPADVARRIGIIADDSMLGRDTPSRGLELTAQYVADQFRAFGLQAGRGKRRRGPAALSHHPASGRRGGRPASRSGRRDRGRGAVRSRSRALRPGPGAAAPVSGAVVLLGGALDRRRRDRGPAAAGRIVLSRIAASAADRADQVTRALRLAGPRRSSCSPTSGRGLRRPPPEQRPRGPRSTSGS